MKVRDMVATGENANQEDAASFAGLEWTRPARHLTLGAPQKIAPVNPIFSKLA